LDDIGSLQIGRVVKPGPQDAGRILHANLDVGPVGDPTPRPDPFVLSGRDIDGAGRIDRPLPFDVLDDCIRILEDGAV
jgi:hypothetical protein